MVSAVFHTPLESAPPASSPPALHPQAGAAPVVAAAFHPSLAPVGVLLAVLGYGLGTYGAYICGLILQQVAP